MLILIGTVPTAYALNHAVSARESQDFIAVSTQAAATLGHYATDATIAGDGREQVTTFVRTKELRPDTVAGLQKLVGGVGHDMAIYKELNTSPPRRPAISATICTWPARRCG